MNIFCERKSVLHDDIILTKTCTLDFTNGYSNFVLCFGHSISCKFFHIFISSTFQPHGTPKVLLYLPICVILCLFTQYLYIDKIFLSVLGANLPLTKIVESSLTIATNWIKVPLLKKFTTKRILQNYYYVVFVNKAFQLSIRFD